MDADKAYYKGGVTSKFLKRGEANGGGLGLISKRGGLVLKGGTETPLHPVSVPAIVD